VCAFQIFGHILVTGRNVLLMLKRLGCTQSAEISNGIGRVF